LTFAGSLAEGRAGWTAGPFAGFGSGVELVGFGVVCNGAAVAGFELTPGRGKRGAAVDPAGLLAGADMARAGRGLAGAAVDEACSSGAF
jgi:hypothetical protein